MIKLFNQDCFKLIESNEFQNLIKNRKVILITDPPFNINYHYANYKDKINEDEYYTKLANLINAYSGGVIVQYPENLHKLSIKLNQAPERVVSWVYNSNTARQHRDIAFYKLKPDFSKVLQPYKNLNDKRIKERIKNGKLGCKIYDWWNINQVKNVSKKVSHPCVMPLKVMENIIGILPKDVIIFDAFMGSGTTGVACKNLGVDFIGCEIDTIYYEEAKERIKGEL